MRPRTPVSGVGRVRLPRCHRSFDATRPRRPCQSRARQHRGCSWFLPQQHAVGSDAVPRELIGPGQLPPLLPSKALRRAMCRSHYLSRSPYRTSHERLLRLCPVDSDPICPYRYFLTGRARNKSLIPATQPQRPIPRESPPEAHPQRMCPAQRPRCPKARPFQGSGSRCLRRHRRSPSFPTNIAPPGLLIRRQLGRLHLPTRAAPTADFRDDSKRRHTSFHLVARGHPAVRPTTPPVLTRPHQTSPDLT